MTTYNVKEISELLGTSQETVRRWIRSGKLKAEQDSRKDGNSISELELQKFLKKTPKYAAIAAGSIASMPLMAIPVAVGSLSGLSSSMVLDYLDSEKKTKKAKVNPSELIDHLSKEIKRQEISVVKKKEAILQLQKEIASTDEQIISLNKTIELIQEKMHVDE